MTISEANAANTVANEVLKLVIAGAKVSTVMVNETCCLLINANKALKAGHSSQSFLADLARARAQRSQFEIFESDRNRRKKAVAV